MQRRGGSTPVFYWIPEVFNMPIKVSTDILQKNLNSAACIHNLIISVNNQSSEWFKITFKLIHLFTLVYQAAKDI